MSTYRAKRVRVRLRGWFKWTPLIIAPFLVLLAEAWLHTERIQNDYTVTAINADLRELEGRLDELRQETAVLERMDRMSAKAPDLGLVQPTPNTICYVNSTPGANPALDALYFELASLDEEPSRTLATHAAIE